MLKFIFVTLAVALKRRGVDLVAGGESSCYSKKGGSYVGLEAITAKGQKCAYWKDLKDSHGLGGEANFCRNPDGVEPQPWCAPVDSPDTREPCAVPKCDPQGVWATNYKNKATKVSSKVESAPLNCDCADELYGSTTTTKDTKVGYGFLQSKPSCDCSKPCNCREPCECLKPCNCRKPCACN
eukprot:GEMP01084001.1.p1 GENE.GEMP01084001.1~~GEMP01084001.1.p1  ORF type:complete len:182 (+),score=51.86 GEMP01084001.1:61-606(+)